NLSVGGKSWRDHCELWAFCFRGQKRHSRANAKGPCLVACRCNDAAWARSSDDNCPSLQFWIVALLDGGEKRILIYVYDFARIVCDHPQPITERLGRDKERTPKADGEIIGIKGQAAPE